MSIAICDADFWPVRELGSSWNFKVFKWINFNESFIITYILKIMGFGFKKIRSSSFRDVQKTAKRQDLEYNCT